MRGPGAALRRSLYAAALALAVTGWAPQAAAELSCRTASQLSREYFKLHVAHRRLSPELEERTIDTYLRRIDPSRSLLLEREVAEIRSDLAGVFEEMRRGDCSSLTDLHASLVKRQKRLEDRVREMVEDPEFELDESVELVLDPEERGHPATEEERLALVRSLVHFQMSNYLSAGEPLDEAKRRLIHRYELRVSRVQELEDEEIWSAFLDAFASSLDPHSNYLSAEVLEDFKISMSLSLEGIGVALSERDGYSVVERIIPGGAAARLEKGLRPKDKIIAVAEEGGEPVNIIDMPLREAVSLIRGRKGTSVHLTVLRQGEKTERFPLTIVRDKIDLAEQAAKLRFETREVDGKALKLAILDLPSFYGDSDPSKRQCTDDVARLLEQVKAEKADGLVLDLSRNGGGLLEHAVKISGFFIRRGEVVGVENSRGQRHVLSDSDERILYTGPMVVHTSRVSASASEILAGALKDYRRAVITGDDRTFGKGTVQTVTSLPPGQGALKITTALFFRPGGKSTQNDGVASDVVIPSLLAHDDFGERTQRYALPSQQIEPFMSSFANAIGPEDRWSRVSEAHLTALRTRSSQRVAESEEFAEIQTKLEEAANNDGVVRLEEILREREEANAQNGSDAEDEGDQADASREVGGDGAGEAGAQTGASGESGGETDAAAEEEPIGPQLAEAINVLSDLIVAARGHTDLADNSATLAP